jgi:hypothetical protein
MMAAVSACATAAFTLLVAAIKALTEWRGDHFERVPPVLGVLGLGVLTALLVGIGALLRGGPDPVTRRWGWASIACAFLSPAAFIAIVLASTF